MSKGFRLEVKPLAAAIFSIAAVISIPCPPVAAQDNPPPGSSEPSFLSALQKFVDDNKLRLIPGPLNMYVDDQKAKIYLETVEPDDDLIYAVTLMSGVGTTHLTSASGAMDRGMNSRERLVAFRRLGPRVLLVERNTNFLTPGIYLGEPRDASQSFANAVIWGFEVKATARDKTVDRERFLLDATSFFLRDGLDVVGTLRGAKQGTYKFDETRSAIDTKAIRKAEKSVDVEVVSTFVNDAPVGDEDARKLLEGVVADRSAISVRQRHSLIKLPEPGYRTRDYDPRSGFFALTYRDPSASSKRSLEQRRIVRFRLNAEPTKPVKPIVFYVDPSVPEVYRQDVIEGASWWNSAFEAAGFKEAFKVELLPSGVDPMAIGVNIIVWVPRSSRGWSYGMSIKDPRTGEILKSIVRLDGMRIQFDRRIMEGLTAPYGRDDSALAEIEAAVRQRLRNLVAHEVGHGLGVRHHFIGSAQSDSSVMDYPFPRVQINSQGVPMVSSSSFGTGIGAWDKIAIQYGYQQFGTGKEEDELDRILRNARAHGYYWMTDEDWRGGAEPQVVGWDQGKDPVGALEEVMKLRSAALTRFSSDVIPTSSPLAEAQDTLVPIYLLHRFQVQAVGAMLGGLHYEHAMRDSPPPRAVPGDQQRRALRALLSTLDATSLTLPQSIVSLLVPRPPYHEATNESFSGTTGVTFDTIAPAVVAAKLSLDQILDEQRAARMVESNARDPSLPGFSEVLRSLTQATWREEQKLGLVGAVQRAVARATLESLLTISADQKASPQVRAACWLAVLDLRDWLRATPKPVMDEWRAHYALAISDIDRVERDASQFKAVPPTIPPGQPMGYN